MIDLRKLSVSVRPKSYPFGMDAETTATALRLLAHDIEEKNVLLQGALILNEASLDDFQFETIMICVARKDG